MKQYYYYKDDPTNKVSKTTVPKIRVITIYNNYFNFMCNINVSIIKY